MEASEYKNIYEKEERHFFYRANHALFLSHVSYLGTKLGRQLKILDAGAGTGLLAKKLKKFGEVTGVDINPEAIYFSKKRGVNVKKTSVNKLPFKSETFDLVVSMDVLYHRKVNDKKALSEIYRVLKPRGLLLLRVPASPILFSSHDRYVHTRERYTKQKLLGRLEKAGFKVEKISYINTILFFPALLKFLYEKIIKSDHSSSNIKQIPERLNQVILTFLSFENWLLKYASLPFGIGLFAVAKKKELP